MNFNPTNDEITDLHALLQQKIKDTRSGSGKRHELAFVLINFMISVLRIYGPLSISKLQRQMKRQNHDLSIALKVESLCCISRVQLTRILSLLDYESFNIISNSYWNIELDRSEWKAIDGKELRGTIDKSNGEKRGLNIVLAVSHNSKQQEILGFYSGKKESERTIVQESLKKEQRSSSGKFTFDALHNSESLLTQLNLDGSYYLSQIKGNQKYLLNDLKQICLEGKPLAELKEECKGHGRLDTREYQVFAINKDALNSRWQFASVLRVVKVNRQRVNNKTGKQNNETCYYISNNVENDIELTMAVKKHWRVETINRIRDVSFGEDNLYTLNYEVQKSVASITTFVLNGLIRYDKNNNLTALREDLAQDQNFNVIRKLLAS